MKNNELEVIQPLPVVNRDPESILRFAIESKASVETIERMMNVRRELKAEQAKEAFDLSLAAFQQECPLIIKRKCGARDAYKYAPLDDIVAQTKDLIKKHGFSFTITSDIESGWVKAICRVRHSQGHSEVSEFKAPVDNKNTMMTDPQRYGGAMTFSKRYSFCNAFGILTADEDSDARVAIDKPKGPMKATAKMRDLMIERLKEYKLDVKAMEYAIFKDWIQPGDTLHGWPLDNVPVNKTEMETLRQAIANFKPE